MSLNLLEQSYDKLSDLILKQHDTSVKRELSIIRGKIAIYLKYQNINHEKYGNPSPIREQASIYNPENQLYVNTPNNLYNGEDEEDEKDEIIRREVKNEFNNIKNSPRLINVENNINSLYENVSLNQHQPSVYRDTENYYTNTMSNDNSKFEHTDFMA